MGASGSGHTHAAPSAEEIERRTFLTRLTFLAMAGGLAAAFAGLASIAGRFLLPRAGEDPAGSTSQKSRACRRGDADA